MIDKNESPEKSKDKESDKLLEEKPKDKSREEEVESKEGDPEVEDPRLYSPLLESDSVSPKERVSEDPTSEEEDSSKNKTKTI